MSFPTDSVYCTHEDSSSDCCLLRYCCRRRPTSTCEFLVIPLVNETNYVLLHEKYSRKRMANRHLPLILIVEPTVHMEVLMECANRHPVRVDQAKKDTITDMTTTVTPTSRVHHLRAHQSLSILT
ncbi:hypothetical protein Y032_0010g925 [Ancylostoma ceylanicum]|uniref:Uncharacterized protein n=1 Tax=Ancylostoma ceylanicum TaxID=53326 RepID=A0A016VI61_9BILA|nr:hypothetical protein Y032_0010g925 [Ancylostoma ceylanicum]